MKICYTILYACAVFVFCGSAGAESASMQDLFIQGDYGRIAEIKPDTEEKASYVLRSLLFTGQYEKVLEKGSIFAASFPESGSVKQITAKACIETGKLKRVKKLYSEWKDAVAGEYLDCLVLTRSDRELMQKSMSIINRFRKKKPESLRDALLVSKAYACARQHQKAMDVLQEYKPANPLESAELRVAAGDLFSEKYNSAAALKEYSEALKLCGSFIPARTGAALVYLNKGALSRCAQVCAEVLAINPSHPEARMHLAVIAFLEEDYAASAKVLEKVFRINPHLPQAHALKCGILKFERNEEAFTTGLEQGRNLEYAPYYFDYYLASIFMRRNKTDEALSYLRPLLGVYPDDAPVLSAIGKILLRKGQLEDGKAMFERAFELDSYNILNYNTLNLLDKVNQYSRKETEHFYLIYDPDVDTVTARYFHEHVETIFRELAEQYRYEPDEKCYIFFFPDHLYLAVMTTGMPELGMPALCVGNSVYCDTPNVLKTHLSMNWYKVIRHECVHVFNLLQTGFNIPHWFTEGLAVLSEEQEHRYEWDRILLRAGILGDLKPVEKMNLGFYRPEHAFSRVQAYAQGYAAVLFIIKNYGFKAINRFLSLFSRGHTFRDAVKPVLGISPEEFQKKLDDYYARYLRNLTITPRFAPGDIPALQQLLQKGNADAGAWLVSHTGDMRLLKYYKEKFGDVPDAVKTAQAAYLLSQGKPDNALEVLDAVKLDRGFAYYRTKGYCYAEKNKQEKALEALTEAWKRYKWEPETIYRIARIFRKKKRPDTYRLWMERYIAVEDTRIERNIEYILYLMEISDSQRAVYMLKRTKMVNPSHADVRVLLGKCLLILKQPKEAIEEYRAAFRIDPKNESVRNDLIRILRFAGKNREADELDK